MLMWDAVYWQLTKDEHPFSPVQAGAEIAPYVVHIDAISKGSPPPACGSAGPCCPRTSRPR